MAETVTVTCGEEKFFPQRYNGFTVGPISYTTEVQEDETAKEAMIRANKVLVEIMDKMFIVKQRRFLQHLKSLKE